MHLIYNIAIQVTYFVLICASVFNEKLKKGVVGRKHTFTTLKHGLRKTDQTIWFHCASLGEYEQGLPVFIELRKLYKKHKIILSFFSPSGYEIRKNTAVADIVVYLPLDTPKNAKTFLRIVNPELSVFVKYDIWPNYLLELQKQNLRVILISALFRKNQPYFKFYGNLFRKALFAFEHIFTQNEVSKNLLRSLNYENVTVSGDTRFDRVANQLKMDNSLSFIESFKDSKLCVVAGSTWPEDENLLVNFINSEVSKNVKFIIAPHNIKWHQIKHLKNSINHDVVLFSEKDTKPLSSAKVFIIDVIGILSKIYSYSNIAYVGGAVGNTGLHNILEPAVFGVPIIIGKYHKKFPEAQTMIDAGGVFSIANQKEFNIILEKLLLDDEKRQFSGNTNSNYINESKGALLKIVDYLS